MTKYLLAIVILFMGMDIKIKQKQWQRMKKAGSIKRVSDYWLSSDPNHNCADLNFEGQINFFDYAIYLRMKGL